MEVSRVKVRLEVAFVLRTPAIPGDQSQRDLTDNYSQNRCVTCGSSVVNFCLRKDTFKRGEICSSTAVKSPFSAREQSCAVEAAQLLGVRGGCLLGVRFAGHSAVVCSSTLACVRDSASTLFMACGVQYRFLNARARQENPPFEDCRDSTAVETACKRWTLKTRPGVQEGSSSMFGGS